MITEPPKLLEVLRSRQEQARVANASYAATIAGEHSMRYWLAMAAKQAREAAGRKQVHVAASADRDQSTIYRFESGGSWPRDTDAVVAAYADDLDITPIELWDSALDLWRNATPDEEGELGPVTAELGREEKAASRSQRKPARSATRAARQQRKSA